MTKLRILYCTDTLSVGGTEHQLVELVTRLDCRRFELFVLCLYGERAGRSLHFQPSLVSAGLPFEVLDLDWHTTDKLRGIAAIVRICRWFRPDIIHAVNYHSVLLTKLASLALPRSVRLISSVYVRYTPKQLLYEFLSSPVCSAIVCNGPNIQAQIRLCPRVELIYNGVDLARFASNSGSSLSMLRECLALGAQRVIVMLCRISHQKSPHLLVEALGVLKVRGKLPPDVRVFIIGEVDSQLSRTKLVETITRYGLNETIKLLRPTMQPEVFYRMADFTVLTSLWEGLPNVLLESLAAGRPVIVSEAANAAGIVQHGVTGWIVPTGDVSELARTLWEVLQLPIEKLRAMSAQCQASVACFGVERMVAEYVSLYERVTNCM